MKQLLPTCVALGLSLSMAGAATTYVYVESNIGLVPGQNSVYAYSANSTGKLTAVSGSPFLSGGTGVLDPSGLGAFDADQQVAASPDGSLLFAVNGHSDDISAFTINADGSLTSVTGSPFPSNGQDPCSIGIGSAPGLDQMIVANKHADSSQDIDSSLPNFTTFSVDPTGALTANPNSTQTLVAGSSPSQALTRSKGHGLFGMEFMGASINSYIVNKDGTLTQVDSIAPPSDGGGVFLGEVSLPGGRYLYAGLPGANQIGVYHFTAAGKLKYVRSIANAGTAVCWLAIDPTNSFLVDSETESATVTSYSLATPSNPTQISHLQLNAVTATNLAFDPAGGFVYVLAGNVIHTLNIDGSGNLTETVRALSLPEPTGEKPLGLVVVRK